MDSKITWAIIIGTLILIALVWGGWDCYVYFYKGEVESTFSRIIYRVASRSPIIAVTIGAIIGVLAGHFFWPQTPKDEEKP